MHKMSIKSAILPLTKSDFRISANLTCRAEMNEHNCNVCSGIFMLFKGVRYCVFGPFLISDFRSVTSRAEMNEHNCIVCSPTIVGSSEAKVLRSPVVQKKKNKYVFGQIRPQIQIYIWSNTFLNVNVYFANYVFKYKCDKQYL